MARRAGRPRAGQEALTRGRILDAALRLVDEEGMGALSMRRLAGELGVDPMAIYHHLPNKKAVLSGLVEAVFSGMRVPDEIGREAGWEERVRAWARAFRGVVLAHPNLVTYVVSTPEAAASATLESTEELYAAFEEAGMAPGKIVRATDLVVDYVNGFALAEASGALGGPDERREMLALLDSLPEDRLPAMRRTLRAVAGDELKADFEFGLRTILAGLEDAPGGRRGEAARPR